MLVLAEGSITELMRNLMWSNIVSNTHSGKFVYLQPEND